MTLYFRMTALPIIVLIFLSSASGTSLSGECFVGGQNSFRDGSSDFTVFDGACTTFKCDNGTARFMYRGCHEFGLCVQVNTYTMNNCNLYQCRESRQGRNPGYNYKLIQEGCHEFGRCVQFNTYTMNNCNLYQCRESRQGRNPGYNYKLIQEGCSVNGICYQIGQRYVENCNTYECVNVTQGDIPHSAIQWISGGCQGLEGKCYSLSERLKCDCKTYKCTKTLQNNIEIYSLSFVRSGCKFLGKCYGVGERYEHNCHKYECITTTQAGIQLTINKRTQEGCNILGKCYAVGESYQSTEDCHMYKCVKIRGIYVRRRIREGCYGFDKCYPLSNKFQFECHTYQCTKVTKHGKADYIPIRVHTGCQAFGRCYNSGETFEHNCIPYTCMPTETLPDGSTYYAAKPSRPDCKLFGECAHLNEVFQRGSFSHQCDEEFSYFSEADRSFFNATRCSQTRDCYNGDSRIRYQCTIFQQFQTLINNSTNFDFLQAVLGDCKGYELCNYTGEIRIIGRHTYECTRTNEYDNSYYFATLIRPGPTIPTTEPVNPGVTFSHSHDGRLWSRCVYQRQTALTFLYNCQD